MEGLPDWAKGTFNGYVAGGAPSSATDPDAQDARSTNGLATVTVLAVGRISGKFQELGTNWTFSAASYTAATSTAAPAGGDSVGAAASAAAPAGGGSGEAAGGVFGGFVCSNMVAKYAYKVKSGKKTVTEYMERTFHLAVSPVPIVSNVPDVPDVPIRGMAQMVEDGEAGTAIEAWQNLWGRADYKALGKRLFTSKSGKKTLAYKTYTVDVCTNDIGHVYFLKQGDDKTGLTCFITLLLKVTTAGAVTATMTFDTGKTKKDPKTKKTVKVIYKPTCQSVVVPLVAADAEQFASEVPLYFLPSAANGFEGFAGSVAVP